MLLLHFCGDGNSKSRYISFWSGKNIDLLLFLVFLCTSVPTHHKVQCSHIWGMSLTSCLPCLLRYQFDLNQCAKFLLLNAKLEKQAIFFKLWQSFFKSYMFSMDILARNSAQNFIKLSSDHEKEITLRLSTNAPLWTFSKQKGMFSVDGFP